MSSYRVSRRRVLMRLSGLLAGMGALTLLLFATAGTASAAPAAAGSSSTTTPAAQVGPLQPVSPRSWRGPLPLANPTSDNWSGYYATLPTKAKGFTMVTSTYEQPLVTCPVANAFTVFWVGFDGVTNGTVEQSGTAGLCGAAGAAPTYFAWWEMAPTNAIQPFPRAVVPVQPGDLIRDTVRYNGFTNTYTLIVDNVTKGKTGTATAPNTAIGCGAPNANPACARSSAEWIVERPLVGGMNAPLARWTPSITMFKDYAAVDAGAPKPISKFPHTALDMFNNAHNAFLANVGVLNAAGTSFLDHWIAAGP